MRLLRQSTASQEILLGRFVDLTDGDTAETGLTIANTDIKLWKGGSTVFVNKNSGGATHISDGMYYAVLDATDTDTVGMLTVYVKVAGAFYVSRDYYVMEEIAYDAIFAPSAAMGLSTQAKADVNAEVLDVLVTDTFAEPSGVPAGTSSLKDKLNWLFALGRNKITQTSSTQTLRNNADAANIASASVSDDGTTATRGLWS